MKRGNLAYEYQGRSSTARQLYVKVQRKMQPKNPRARYKTASLIVRINFGSTGCRVWARRYATLEWF
jgi:hypothetical protein